MSGRQHFSDKCTFELLSAYLDGEVTSAERQQVQQWLATDPQIQQLYQRLQVLRQGIHNLPAPEPEYSAQQLSNQVFAKIERQRKQRKRLLWGGGAIAALLVAAVGSIFSDSNSPLLQFAREEESESLIIAFNHPPVEIPSENQISETESLMIPLDHSLIEIPE
jgi:anti-sigma factor RsiW